MADLGYVISHFDLDTDDYNNVTPERIQNAKNNFATTLRGSNPTSDEFLAIAHDIHYQTACVTDRESSPSLLRADRSSNSYNLTEYMLQTLQSQGYQAVTMGECMADPAA